MLAQMLLSSYWLGQVRWTGNAIFLIKPFQHFQHSTAIFFVAIRKYELWNNMMAQSDPVGSFLKRAGALFFACILGCAAQDRCAFWHHSGSFVVQILQVSALTRMLQAWSVPRPYMLAEGWRSIVPTEQLQSDLVCISHCMLKHSS